MADSNASGEPRKRIKVGDESPVSRKKVEVYTSEDASFTATQTELDREKKLVST